ncbi:hypothetical protein H0H93_008676 [Arthromyces matolae]|nr:hypothetical protein H0H93_008676 [Arthromyces matolae]
MLHLHHAYAAYPARSICHLQLSNAQLILYSSADVVILLNASNLSLVRVLALSEAFPNTSDHISSVTVDSGMSLIFASVNNRIAAWGLSGVKKDAWIIHSTLLLPENRIITALDCKSEPGLLAVGSQHSISVYTLILENDLPTWSQKWTIRAATPNLIQFAPSLQYIAALSECGKVLRLHSTTSGRQSQSIPHPRTITNFTWRQTQAASRDDLILYTVTDDSTFRIFLPVLDSPQHLQLHASLDIFSSLPFSIASHQSRLASSVFWLDGPNVERALKETLKKWSNQDDTRLARIKDIIEDRYDLFLQVLGDGSVVLGAIANLDRRPPTLLKQFTLQQLPPSTLPGPPSSLSLLPNLDSKLMTLVTTSPLATYDVSSITFFDAQKEGLQLSSSLLPRVATEETKVVRLIRTPEGAGVGVVRLSGGEAWRVVQNGTQLVRSSSWSSADHVVVLQRGHTFVTYLEKNKTITLHSVPPQKITIPSIAFLFSTLSEDEGDSIVGITSDLSILQFRAYSGPSPSLTLRSQSTLPLPYPPKFILPVDPMAWGQRQLRVEPDVLLSVSHEGELNFWVPEITQTPPWVRTGIVKTGRRDIRKASCSSAKKTALGGETINDLDWTSTPDNQSILAVGFRHRVELLCQQRMTYFDEGPGWATCTIINVGGFIPIPISDSIWLDHGSLLIAAGHQMLLYGPLAASADETLFEYAARHNGPLVDYHPQMILQCLLWGKVELVKDIIVNLSKDIAVHVQDHNGGQWTSLPVESFYQKDSSASIDEQRRALDANGLRYLISMRSFYILNRRASRPSSPQSKGSQRMLSGKRERLRYRDMIWAFHSESQDLLLNASISACSDKFSWANARAVGIPIWLTSVDTLKAQMEVIARNEYMAGDDRDPTACSLYYFALGKVKLVHGLWKQAAWHKEQTVMLKFLSNNFTEPHWRTAALKNAFVLLSKQRFAALHTYAIEYAAAFFLLGGSLKDAVNVCLKQLDDFQLAVALARVMEQSNEGPILFEILNSTVLPVAFKNGNRWLASWAFWLLHRRDMAVRILLTPLRDIASALNIRVTEIGEPHYDDPSLALLFSQLRSKTLQTAKGTSEISGRLEFNFVLQMARVFCRMGCHMLGLDLLRSWSFERPSGSSLIQIPSTSLPPSPTISRRSLFDRSARRRSTIMIDMPIASSPPSRPASPRIPPVIPEEQAEVSQPRENLFAAKLGIGNLMKTAKQDLEVPEFDMNAFF